MRHALAVTLLFVAGAAQASAITIDFEEFSVGDGAGPYPTVLTSQGHELTGQAAPFTSTEVITGTNTGGTNAYGGTSAGPGQDGFGYGAFVTLEEPGGGWFAIHSLDLFMDTDPAGWEEIRGTLAGGGTTFLTSVPVGTGDWLNLESVTFRAEGNGFGFGFGTVEVDNIVLTALTPFAANIPIENPTTGGVYFGQAVSTDGNRLLVGEFIDDGKAHLFDSATGNLLHSFDNPTPDPTYIESFGLAVGVSGDHVLVGDPADTTTGLFSGTAFLYDAVSGNLVHTFDNPSPNNYDQFGNSVSVDGDRIVVGAYQDDTLAKNGGRAYLFDAVSGNLVRTFENPAAPYFNDRFGGAVSVSGDRVLVGAPGDWTTGSATGSAYLFDAVTGSLTHTFVNPSPDLFDNFGQSVGVSGIWALVGAPNDDTTANNSGRAYLYHAISGNLIHTFENPSPDDDLFGISVSVSGSWALVGAYSDDTTGVNSGRAYLFDAVTGNLLRTFENPSPDVDDRFGGAVSVSGDQVLIGAERDDSIGTNRGRAYLFFNGFAPEIDIDPVTPDDTIHPHHDGGPAAVNGLDDTTRVTVLGLSVADGDAVDFDTGTIDPATLSFGPARGGIDPASTPLFNQFVDGDSVPDAVFEFLNSDAGILCNQTETALDGYTTVASGATRFAGAEAITTNCVAGCHN